MTMKKLAAVALVIATTGASFAAMAAEEAHPFYVRGQVGLGRSYVDNTTVMANAIHLDSNKAPKLAGRVAGGYKINDTFSAELGYTQFSHESRSLTLTSPVGNFHTGRLQTNSHAIDALVKASVPVTDQVAVFAGAGAAYYTVKQSLTDSILTNGVRESRTNNAIRPEFTVGTSYKLNENIALDASYTQIIGKGSPKEYLDNGLHHSKYMPDAQLLAIGASYSF